MADARDPFEAPVSQAQHLDAYVTSIRAGDARAFESVYRVLARPLIDFAAGILGDMPTARDVVADVFVALWERRAAWHPSHGVRAYLFLAVRHRAIDVVRNTRRHDRTHDAILATDERPGMSVPPIPVDRALDLAEQVDAAFQAIALLPPARRTAMTLCWQAGLSTAEIAEIMGIGKNAVEQHLSRGLKTLRALLPRDLSD